MQEAIPEGPIQGHRLLRRCRQIACQYDWVSLVNSAKGREIDSGWFRLLSCVGTSVFQRRFRHRWSSVPAVATGAATGIPVNMAVQFLSMGAPLFGGESQSYRVLYRFKHVHVRQTTYSIRIL